MRVAKGNQVTFSKVRFFGLMIIFLIFATPGAFSSGTFKEAWILSYCDSPKTFKELHHLIDQGDITAAEMHYRIKVSAGECTDLTRHGLMMSFIGERIVTRYENDVQGKTFVLEGYIVNADESRGDNSFIWVAEEYISNFIEKLDSKPIFEPEPPKHRGFHKGRQDT